MPEVNHELTGSSSWVYKRLTEPLGLREHQMNIRLTHLNDCIRQAEADLRKCREERNALLIELSGFKPGTEFEQGGNRYRVRSISAAAKGSEVWLVCDWWTSAKKWSQGTRVVNHQIKD
jgi:hypothetical protein